jgi:Aldo/keto reductase family
MQYRRLGRFGLKVSPLCLGTMMFGGETDEQVAQKIVRHAFEAGINFIDSADAYNEGRSEESHRAGHRRRARALGGRDQAGEPGGPGAERRRSVAQMGDDCGGGQPTPARHRLHRHLLPSQGGPRDAARGDGARASRPRARRQNPLFRSVELPLLAGRRLHRLAREAGIDGPLVSQPYYNAMNRMPEVEHLPACAYFGMGVVAARLGGPKRARNLSPERWAEVAKKAARMRWGKGRVARVKKEHA